jgi:hypothetical protein
MLRRNFFLILFIGMYCLFPQQSMASSKDSTRFIKLYEDTLKRLQLERLDIHKSDRQKEEANTRFQTMMQTALRLPGSFTYAFDSLTTIARLESPDKQFRIINWCLPKSDGTQEYFGFIQSLNPKTKKYLLYTLTDKTADIKDPQSKVCTADQWYGVLYYKIVVEKTDKKPFYTLLAWKGSTKEVNKKVIDIITLSPEGAPSFGKAIFASLPSNFKGSPKRLIFQYSSNVSMTLDYDSKKDMILFDHLGPTEPGLEGQYQFYGPSFQIDGLTFKGDKWVFSENIDARNANYGDDKFQDPEKEDHHADKKAIYTPH